MKLPTPDLQIGFGLRLRGGARDILQVSLLETVARVDLNALNADLSRIAPVSAIKVLASLGMRGELAFATPTLLRANPRLLGYYRLLLGYSQKDFYGKRIGAGRFKAMEVQGRIATRLESELDDISIALSRAAAELIQGLSGATPSATFLNDLTLLTLGAQFRGSANNTIGAAGVRDVVQLIRALTIEASPSIIGNQLNLKNASGRLVLVEFGADPDVTVRVALHGDEIDKALAIEIKAGTDGSNIYNRLGEAEKSHTTARRDGFTDFWTIVNTPSFDEEKAKQKSPATNRFYRLSEIIDESSTTHADFRSRLLAKIGL